MIHDTSRANNALSCCSLRYCRDLRYNENSKNKNLKKMFFYTELLTVFFHNKDLVV